MPALGFLLLAASALLAQESSGVTPPPGKMVFFPFDEVSIPWRDNLKVTFEKPKKHAANPILGAGSELAPDGFGAVLYGTIIREGDRFRMWYLAWPRHDSRIPGDAESIGDYRPVAYAESRDGVHWTRPELGLTEFRGNKRNNLVLVEPAGHPYARSHDFISVLLDPADPDPRRRYKMAYIARDEARRIVTTATAVSPDGLRWTLVNSGMITGGHYEHTSLIRFKGLYYAAGQNMDPYGGHLPDGSPAGRVMTVFFSPDFVHWSKGRALSFYRADYTPKPAAYGQETHMGAGLWNRGNVILVCMGAGTATPSRASRRVWPA